MSKTLWNHPRHGAPAPIRARIEHALADRQTPSLGARVQSAIEIAYHAGFDTAEPQLAELDEFERQLRTKAPTLAIYQRDHSVELENQKRARDLWQRLRPWAKGPPAHELAKQAAAAREAADRAAAVERRAVELLAQQERMRIDAAHRDAVQAAERELEQ
ncbi:MAG: hypothetical protein HS104_09750 [Polyangiaceae bacterium]|nr:hypothetical protein [Polyangiaceae bacterium]MCE7894392.1 hypothetical protein [Sorangiineae bacterium PRO1]